MVAYPFSDDLEAGGPWVLSGMWHKVSIGGSNPYALAHSPVSSYWYGQDATGNYNTGLETSGALTGPGVLIPPGASTATLSFWGWYQTETNGITWDQRWVQLSVNGGPWQNFAQLSGDIMSQWNYYSFSLSAYAGQTVQLRFWFDSIDGVANAYRGWYVDDVAVGGPVTVTPTRSASPSATRTPSPTATPSTTPSGSPSASPSASVTLTATISPSYTASPTVSVSPTITATRTPWGPTGFHTATPTPVALLSEDVLDAPYPEPFRPGTGPLTLPFGLAQAEKLTLKVYDLRGQEVAVLVDGVDYPAGKALLTWDGRVDGGTSAASGLYLILFKTPLTRQTRRVVLLR
jgi:hypothetical protein